MIDIKQQQKIEQNLTLSARQLQSLQLLYVPIFELEQSINSAVENNPVLEYEEFAADRLSEKLPTEDFSDNFNHENSDSFDNYNDNFEYENYDGDVAEKQQKRDNFFAAISEEDSLQTQLLNELSYLNLSEKQFEIGEEIIGNIEESGIVGTTLADIAMVCNADLDEVEEVLHIIQSIRTPGVGARDLAECLKLQLIASNRQDELLFELIDNYLPEIGDNNLSYIAENMNISSERLNQLLAEIRTLNPHPGAVAAENKSNFIIPEAEIRFDEELSQYRLILNDYYIPKIRVSEKYTNLLNDKFLSKEDREYLKQKISDAQTFQGSLEMREKTIERIAELIMIEQHDFWANGVNSLKPMTMAQVAEQLGVHEATVSRACSGKYILTPQGLLEFKYFFSHGVKSSDGVELSNLAVKEKIRHYIDTEDAEKPLSDEKIASLLKSANINISRRTVAKYRDSMNIAPAHKRKTIF